MPWAKSFCPFRAYGVSKSTSPLGVPADLQSAVKKVRPIKTGGFVIPQQKEKHTPLLRIANPQRLNRLGHFLTPDCKSGETPSGNKELVIPCLEYGVLADFPTCKSYVLYFSGSDGRPPENFLPTHHFVPGNGKKLPQ